MTERIWYFGDSFVGEARYRYEPPPCPVSYWTCLVNEAFGLDPGKALMAGGLFGEDTLNFGLGGSSLEYSYWQFKQQVDNFQPNDIVIFVLTHPKRRWCNFPDPKNTNLHAAGDIAKWEYTHLNIEPIEQMKTQHFLWYLHAIKEQKKLRAMVVMEAFHNNKLDQLEFPDSIIHNNGDLWMNIAKPQYHNYGGDNPKLWTKKELPETICHMSKRNNEILAEKVVTAIHRHHRSSKEAKKRGTINCKRNFIKKEFDFMLMEPNMRILEIEDDNRKQIKQAERKYELPVWL